MFAKRNIAVMVIMMLTAALMFSGCAGNQSASSDFFAMDTYMSITAYGSKADAAVKKAEDYVQNMDMLMSTGDAGSEISRLNANGSAQLSDDTATVLKCALQVCKDTDGCFDPTVYALSEIWGFTTKEYTVPNDAGISSARKCVDASAVRVDDNDVAVIDTEGVKVDMGGIAKGYTSTGVMDIFREYGIKSGIVNLGGNVQMMGRKPDGSQWKIGIRNPDADTGYFGVLSAENTAVVTSGGYERYFEQDGRTYHHIIDPRTGYPADSGLLSVTVVSNDGTLADALSTALFVMGGSEAVRYWQNSEYDFDIILMKSDKSLIVSKGLKDIFSTKLDVEYVSK